MFGLGKLFKRRAKRDWPKAEIKRHGENEYMITVPNGDLIDKFVGDGFSFRTYPAGDRVTDSNLLTDLGGVYCAKAHLLPKPAPVRSVSDLASAARHQTFGVQPRPDAAKLARANAQRESYSRTYGARERGDEFDPSPIGDIVEVVTRRAEPAPSISSRFDDGGSSSSWGSSSSDSGGGSSSSCSSDSGGGGGGGGCD